MLFSAAFSSADIRYDTVRAEVVAAVHDRQPTLESAVAFHGNALIEFIIVISTFKYPLTVDKRIIHQFRKMMQRMGAEHQPDKRKAVIDTVGDMFLLHHAAAERNQNLRVLSFEIFKRADVSEHSVLGMLADCAGVEQNKIRFVWRVHKIKAGFSEHSLDFFTVGNILLATVGAYVCKRFFTAFANFHDLCNQVHIL